MLERIRQIVIKEFKQTLREPRMRFLLIMPPMVQLVIFGFAVNLDVENARVAFMDLDRTTQSRDLRYRFEASPYFTVAARAESKDDVHRLLDTGHVTAVIRVLPGFGGDVLRGRAATVQVLIDGTDSNSASIIGNYAVRVVSEYSEQAIVKSSPLQPETGEMMETAISRQRPSVRAQTRVWFNEDLRSRNYFVPGVVVNIIMIVTLILTAMAIVREKEIGTMEQLMVTPIRSAELVLGKLLPFALIGILDMMLVTSLALLIFRVPFRGNPLVLFLGGCLFILSTLGVGLFLSTISHTQQQAMMASFFFVMPASMLSGFTFPVRNMPEPIQWLSYANPMRYFMEIVRGVFLKGSGLDVLWPQMLSLAVFGVAILGFSVARFQKRLD